MYAIIHWKAFLTLIQPVYHKLSAKGSCPSIPLKVMLRIHRLQECDYAE